MGNRARIWIQRMNMSAVANRCAAQMNIGSDQKAREAVFPDISENDIDPTKVVFSFDRGGPAKRCTMAWTYSNTHLNGKPIVKQYTVVGESKIR